MHPRLIKEVLVVHSQAIKSGLKSSIFTSNQLIHLYAKHGVLRDAQKLFDEMPQRNVFTWNTIIAAHLRKQDLVRAEALFNSSPYKDLVTYNSMLAGYVNAGDGYETRAFELFSEMHSTVCSCDEGIDEFAHTTMLNLVARLLFAPLGMQLHSYMVKSGTDSSRFSSSSLIDMYSKCGYYREAYRVFDDCREVLDLVCKNAMVAACCRESELDLALEIFWREPELNDSVSWNTIISGFAQNGLYEKALGLFISMVERNIRLNDHTYASVISACCGLRSVKLGKQVHGRVLKAGLIENSYISSGVVDLYCKCLNINYAESAFAAYSEGSVFSITSMIVAYSSLGDMGKARRLFDTLSENNSVVWTALFTGYVRSQDCGAAFDLLRELLAKETKMLDVLILMTLLSACALQASLHPGKQIHAYILRTGVTVDEKLQSSITDMYSKCGYLTYAERVFSGVIEKDAVLYNVMIAGYAHHGHGNEAILLFEEMSGIGIRPDAATFVALLSNCRHAGLVELGEKYFYSMEEQYGIQPEADHYACMIDLYGRAAQLEKATAIMENISFEPDAVLLGAFLNACRMNGNAELASIVEEKLLRIEGQNGSRYVQLANLYAAEGNWDAVGRIRKKMKGKDVQKLPGCSWIYLEKGVKIFTSGDKSLSTDAVYTLLDCLVAEIYHLVQRSNTDHL